MTKGREILSLWRQATAMSFR